MNRPALLLLSVCTVLVPLPALAVESEISRLTGVYNSGYQDRPARLRAEFKSTARGRWDVVFRPVSGQPSPRFRGCALGCVNRMGEMFLLDTSAGRPAAAYLAE